MENIADKKLAIYESTLELVQDHGFHGTSMSMIAQKAEIAAGTIYHYFPSKDQLICDLFLHVKERLAEVIKAELDENGTFKEHFKQMWYSLYRYYVKNPRRLLFFEQFTNSPYCKTKIQIEKDRFYQVFYSFFQKAQQAGCLKNINYMVLGILSHGAILKAAKISSFGKISISDKELDDIIEMSWEGMMTNSSPQC